jgi:3-deoxy-7-phosphoheptulonate synthase
MHATRDLNIEKTVPLIAPRQLLGELPLSATASDTVFTGREAIKRLLAGEDPRLLAIVGPCSIHDPAAAIDYARRLAALAEEVRDQILVVMRVYFEKPRTTVGWKGLINDPHLDDTFDMMEGLRLARRILLEIVDLGLPAATEMLEPITPQYIADLVSLAAIGARTTESPTHRQMASGLSMPVGYKNGTDGNLQVALDAMHAARHPHRFLGIDADGNTCVVFTRGNPWGLLILRGGRSGSNYSPDHVEQAARQLSAAKLPSRLVVDCSHANSDKDYRKQGGVFRAVLEQRLAGTDAVAGVMLESNLVEGQQKLTSDTSTLHYGLSITDGCIGWDETETLLRDACRSLRGR